MSSRQGERLICYCRDCQAAAHYLGHSEMLDEWGGTNAFITTPASMAFFSGIDQMACFRFGPRGPRRWYAKCCNTHLGNTLADPSVQLFSLNMGCVSPASRSLLGEVSRGIFLRDAHGNPRISKASMGGSPAMLIGILLRIFSASLRGLRHKSPFVKDGKPISDAPLLSRDARAEALSKAGF